LLKRRESISIVSRATGFAITIGIFLFVTTSGNAQQSSSASTTTTAASSYSAGTASGNMPANSPAAPADNSGIMIPSPPPPASLNPDASKLTSEAEEAAKRAQSAPPLAPNGQVNTQAQAQAVAEALQAQREHEHNIKSFDRAEKGLLPLSTDQIRDFMRRLETVQKGSQPPSGGPPKPEVRTATLSLDPGVDPPVVNLVSGYVTTITVIDATGEPWPIADVGVGGNFEVSPTQAGSHVVRVMPLTRFGTGNISVILKGLSTPIIFRLAAGGPSVDMRYDARVPKVGPNGKMPIIGRPRLEAGDDAIMMLLDNAPPADAKRMKVSGLDARTMAWMLNNHVYVRTPLTLLSPAWDASVSSADGMTVYEIGDAPVLLMSDNGAMVRARLLRDEDHDK